jgi:hypothetical protein
MSRSLGASWEQIGAKSVRNSTAWKSHGPKQRVLISTNKPSAREIILESLAAMKTRNLLNGFDMTHRQAAIDASAERHVIEISEFKTREYNQYYQLARAPGFFIARSLDCPWKNANRGTRKVSLRRSDMFIDPEQTEIPIAVRRSGAQVSCLRQDNFRSSERRRRKVGRGGL